MAEFTVDLSEIQVVQLISLVAYYSAQDSTSSTTTAVIDTTTSKRKKSTKKKEVEELTPTNIIVGGHNNGLENTLQSSSSSLEKLSLIIELIVNRKFGFNSSVLSEFTSLFSLPLASILLRILGNMLRGLCNSTLSWNVKESSLSSSPPSSSSSSSSELKFEYIDDSDMKLINVIQWIESILESHYKSFLFATLSSSKNSNNLSSDSLESQPLQYVLKSLLCLHEVLNGLEEASNLTELTSGITLHLKRVIKYQKSYQNQSKQLQKHQLSNQQQQIIIQSTNNIIEYNENYQLEVVKF